MKLTQLKTIFQIKCNINILDRELLLKIVFCFLKYKIIFIFKKIHLIILLLKIMFWEFILNFFFNKYHMFSYDPKKIGNMKE